MLERYFPEFLAFFFAEVYDGIDWRRKYSLTSKASLRNHLQDGSL
jgi:hypothetical protein